MKIGLTYDLKAEHHFSQGVAADFYAEFDHEETIEELLKAIESGGHEVVKIGNAKNLLSRIQDLKLDIVFNICEGLGSRNRESEVPVFLDFFKIPYVGSDPLALGLTLDKVMAKRIFVSEGVRTPRFFVAEKESDLAKRDSMKFPFIVKPRHEGSSKGISENSIVSNEEELKKQVLAVAGNYHQPALIEEFISGQEFTVLVIGNDEPQAFPSVQIQILDQLDIGDLIYTSERVNNADIQYVCPSSITPELEQTLRDLALRAYSALDCRDFGRVDFRVDRDGVPYVLEVNPLPSLAKGDVFPLVAKACGMTYNELILKIIDIALKRQGMI